MTVRTKTATYQISSYLDEIPGILALTICDASESEIRRTFGDPVETGTLSVLRDGVERTYSGFAELANVLPIGSGQIQIAMQKRG